MSRSMNKLDPELQGLLEEVAGQVDAGLLRVDPARAREILYPEGPGTSVRAGLLTHAERHLLSVHRAELGRMLYLQAANLLKTDPTFGPCMTARNNTSGGLVLPPPAELLQQSEAAARSAPGPESLLLAQCCSPERQVQPSDLLLAYLKVSPSDSGRVTLALDRIRTRHFSDAELLLRGVLNGRPSSSIRSHALESLGLLECRRGDYPQAALAYAQASEAEPGRSMPVLSSFYTGAQAGLSDATLSAGQQIDDQIDPEDAILREFVADMRTQKDRGVWESLPTVRERLPSVLERLGETSNGFARALFS